MHLHGPFKIEYKKIPAGVAGTIATLQEMRRIVQDSKRDFLVRDVAATIAQPKLQKDFGGEIASLYKFVRDEIRYVKDPRGVEMVQTPRAILRTKAGDCDDKSTLLASLLESLGHATRFVAVGFAPGRYSHVYIEVRRRNGSWVPLETTEPVKAGWAPPRAKSRLVVYN